MKRHQTETQSMDLHFSNFLFCFIKKVQEISYSVKDKKNRPTILILMCVSKLQHSSRNTNRTNQVVVQQIHQSPR